MPLLHVFRTKTIVSLKTVFFFLLTLLTLWGAAVIPQYLDTGPQLLSNADFSSGLEQWQSRKTAADTISVDNGVLALHSADVKTNVALYQTIGKDFGGKKLRLKASLRSRGVLAGDQPWNKARLVLLQYFEDKAQYSLPHIVVALDGSNKWQEVSAVFSIAPDCTGFQVAAEMSRCSGDFFLKNLSLFQVEENPQYKYAQWPIRSAWVLFAFFLFIPYLKNQTVMAPKILLLLTVIVILIGTTMPAALKTDLKERIDLTVTTQTNKIVAVTQAVSEHNTTQTHWLESQVEKVNITKVAHFILFAFLVFVLRRSNPSRPVSGLIVDVFMLAAATELSQFFVENRSPLFRDLLLDMAGGGTGWIAAKPFLAITTDSSF